MRIFLIAGMVLVCLLSACAPAEVIPRATQTPTPDPQMEEEGVLAAALADLYPAEMLVIMVGTQTDVLGLAAAVDIRRVTAELEGLSAETLEDFIERNAESAAVPSSLRLGLPYVLFSDQDRQELFQVNQSGWDVFYNRYPQAPGILSISRVGFNQAYDQALVYLGMQSHWLAGSGNFILLEKVDGHWQVKQQAMSWIS